MSLSKKQRFDIKKKMFLWVKINRGSEKILKIWLD